MSRVWAAGIRKAGFTGELREAEPMKRHVSLKVGGPAALFAVPGRVDDVMVLLAWLEENGVPWILLGGGTNTVFANGGYPGCVVRLGSSFAEIKEEGDAIVSAGAAASLPALVSWSARKGLSGMECLAGIPGTVGGAVFMNAGTGDGAMADVVREVWLCDGRSHRWAPAEELGFSYRSSGIGEAQVILGARVELSPSSTQEVRALLEENAGKRRSSQPSGVPSAGCWFRNPEGHSAGRLIDEAGMKGARCGGAQVSEVHANFLVKVGEATTADFLTLAQKVREAVHDRFGVTLQEEVRVIHG